jgi:DNA-binding MarR family transcriptional regulator
VRRVKKRATNHIEEITRQAKREWSDLDIGNVLLAIYLQRLGSMIAAEFDSYCRRRFKMRVADVRVLIALARVGPPYVRRPTDLFRSLLVSSGAITKQVDRLEARRLVKRVPNPSYGGGFMIQLNDRGRKLVDEVIKSLASGSAVAPAMWTLPARDREAAARFCFNAITLLESSPAPGRRQPKRASPKRRGREKTARNRRD